MFVYVMVIKKMISINCFTKLSYTVESSHFFKYLNKIIYLRLRDKINLKLYITKRKLSFPYTTVVPFG